MAARSARADKVAVDPAQPFKRRARRRLLGAIVFGILIASALPMLLDPEPSFERPALHLDIPSRDTALISPSAAPNPVVSATAAASAGSTPAVVPQAPPAAAVSPPAPVSRPPQAPAAPQAQVQTPPPAVAQPPRPALPQGGASAAVAPPSAALRKPSDTAPSVPPQPAAPQPGRWMVQVGLFSRADNAAALTARIRGLGLPVYTESIDPGPRIRVRVGPFASRADADRARARLTLNNIEATLVSP